jgi:hypothetical protein
MREQIRDARRDEKDERGSGQNRKERETETMCVTIITKIMHTAALFGRIMDK